MSLLTTLLATAVACLGFALIALRGWFFDRSKGRPRCPRCWYDMAGLETLTCPECGKNIRKPKRLYGTRRSYKRLALAVLVLPLVIGPVMMNRALRYGWQGWGGFIPTIVLIHTTDLVSGSNPLAGELFRRMKDDHLTESQWIALARGYLRGSQSDLGTCVSTRSRWPEGSEVMVRIDQNSPWEGHHFGRRILIQRSGAAAVAHHVGTRASPSFGARGTIGRDQSLSLGEFPVGVHKLQLRCVLQEAQIRSFANPDILGWRELLSSTTELEFEVVAADERVMRPASSAELDDVVVEALQGRVTLSSIWGPRGTAAMPAIPLSEPVTLAFVLELVSGDDVATPMAQGWLSASMRPGDWCRLSRIGDTSALWNAFHADPACRVRIRSSAALALRDFDSTVYWVGEVEVPAAGFLVPIGPP